MESHVAETQKIRLGSSLRGPPAAGRTVQPSLILPHSIRNLPAKASGVKHKHRKAEHLLTRNHYKLGGTRSGEFYSFDFLAGHHANLN